MYLWTDEEIAHLINEYKVHGIESACELFTKVKGKSMASIGFIFRGYDYFEDMYVKHVICYGIDKAHEYKLTDGLDDMICKHYLDEPKKVYKYSKDNGISNLVVEVRAREIGLPIVKI